MSAPSKENDLVAFPKSFVVKRERWLRGGIGTLLDSKGCMCCLGFLARAAGLDDEQLLEHGSPEDVDAPSEAVVTAFGPLVKLVRNSLEDHDDSQRLCDTDACDLLVNVNDDGTIDDAARELRLKELFAKAGVEVEFQ